MHDTALVNCREFFECYASGFKHEPSVKVVDVGALDVNGSLRQVIPGDFTYIGLDFTAGRGVDVVLTDPYVFPIASSSVDIVLSSSCFEHSELFWLTFIEALRILKPSGLLYLNVPSNGHFHRYPVDCWRFYPDSGRALIAWAKRNGIDAALLESYTSMQANDVWNDFVGVFAKSESNVARFSTRILHKKKAYTNGLLYGSSEFLRYSALPEDKSKLEAAIARTIRK